MSSKDIFNEPNEYPAMTPAAFADRSAWDGFLIKRVALTFGIRSGAYRPAPVVNHDD